jgi:hypothetical protein
MACTSSKPFSFRLFNFFSLKYVTSSDWSIIFSDSDWRYICILLTFTFVLHARYSSMCVKLPVHIFLHDLRFDEEWNEVLHEVILFMALLLPLLSYRSNFHPTVGYGYAVEHFTSSDTFRPVCTVWRVGKATVSLNLMTNKGSYWTYLNCINNFSDRLCGLVVRVLDYWSGGPGSIPRHYQKEKNSGSGTGSAQPHEYNWGATS